MVEVQGKINMRGFINQGPFTHHYENNVETAFDGSREKGVDPFIPKDRGKSENKNREVGAKIGIKGCPFQVSEKITKILEVTRPKESRVAGRIRDIKKEEKNSPAAIKNLLLRKAAHKRMDNRLLQRLTPSSSLIIPY